MKYRNSKSTLFLMVLIIAILFFAVTSAVCAQIFAKSHILSTKTTRLNHAVAQAESAAESFKAVNGSLEAMAKLFPGAALDKDTLTISYDADWQPFTADVKNSGSGTEGISTEDTGTEGTSTEDTRGVPTGSDRQSAYELTLIRLMDEGHCVRAHIDVTVAGSSDAIYTLDIQKYVKGR